MALRGVPVRTLSTVTEAAKVRFVSTLVAGAGAVTAVAPAATVGELGDV